MPQCLENDSDITTSEKSLVRRLILFLLTIQSRFYLTDTMLDLMFRFLKVFFTVLGRIHQELADIGKLVPPSLHIARKNYKENDKVRHYVACKRCHSLYYLHECLEGHGQHQRPIVCVHTPFKNHRRPKSCGSPLLKTVELSSGKRYFIPS